MIHRHSGVEQAAYSDLLRLLRDDAVVGIQGEPQLRKRNNRGCWYDRLRIGNEIKATYLGEDTPEMRTRIELHRELAAQSRSRRQERGRLVRIVRAEGMTGFGDETGPLFAAMAETRVFRLGGTLVGTNAFRLYEGELGVRIHPQKKYEDHQGPLSPSANPTGPTLSSLRCTT